MKKFIYLDSNSLNSFVSQINKGITTGTVLESSKEKSNTQSTESAINGEGEANLKLLGTGFGAHIEGNLSNEREKFDGTTDKNIINKQSYDEVFEEFLQNITESKNLKSIETIEKIGDFIKINTNMSIIDLKYYLKLFSPGGFLDAMIEQEINSQAKEVVEQTKQPGQNSAQIAYRIEKLKKNLKKESTQTYKIVCDSLRAIMDLMPYDKIIFAGNFIIMIDDKFFRDNPSIIANKYGGDLEIIGYVTNEIKPQSSENPNENIFETFPNIVNSLLLDMFKKEKLMIVHPIGIYYN